MNGTIFTILVMLAGLLGQAVPPGASLEGVVVRIGTDEPVKHARILLSNVNGRLADSIAATVDDNGKFSIHDIPPGTYRLFTHHDDYVRAEYGQRAVTRPGVTIPISAGQTISNLKLTMTPTGVISGRVLNANGEPASRILISALKRSYVEGERITTSVVEAQTNDLGEYRLYGVAPGAYLIRATPFGFRGIQGGSYVTSNPPQLDALISIADGHTPLANLAARGDFIAPAALEGQIYPELFFPGTANLSNAQTISLEAGAIRDGINFTMVAMPAASIAGRGVHVRGQLIDGTNGQPAANSNATLHLPERPYAMESMLGTLSGLATGSFDFANVTPGRYLISGSIAAEGGDILIDVGNVDIENLRIILQPRSNLTGRVTIEGRPGADNAALAGVTVRIQLSEYFRTAAVRADGSFTMPNLPAGEYRIALGGGSPDYFLKAAHLGETEVLSAGLRLAKPTSQPLELLVSPNAGIVEGIVFEDGRRPAAAVTVVVIPEGARRRQFDLYRIAVSDAAGRFRIKGLVPGEYKVFAWEDLEENSWQDSEILRPFEARGKTIRIAEGDHENIELEMIKSPSQR